LGLPPLDLNAGYPDAAARIRLDLERLGAKALRIAMDADPTFEARYDEAGLRLLLHDAELFAERVALCLETGRPDLAHDYAEWTAPLYRRRRVPMDDLIACATASTAFPACSLRRVPPLAALDGRSVYRWHRRIKRRAPSGLILALLYKGDRDR
jgi:hypothetical protein